MALIQCPECKQEISSKAEHCIHCGCRFVICPECETVYPEKIEFCTECGFSFEQKKADITDTTDKKTTYDKNIKDLWDAWGRQQQIITKLLRSRLVNLILIIAFVAMPVLAAVNLIKWSNGNIDMFAQFQSTLSNVKLCCILFVIFYVAVSIFRNLSEFVVIKDFKNWIYLQKLDLKEIIKQNLILAQNQITLEEAALLGIVMRIDLNADDIGFNVKQQKKRIITVCLSLIFALLMIWFAISNVEIYMSAELWQSDYLGTSGFNLSMIEHWWILICACVVFILGFIYSKFVDKQENKYIKEQFEKKYPELKKSRS